MLFCEACSVSYPESDKKWRCDCGAPLQLTGWDMPFAPDASRQGLWRYASSLPIERPDEVVSFGEGSTPLVHRSWQAGGKHIQAHFKLDYLCPSGSYKDRGMALLMNRLRELGITEVIEDSSGNAGAAMSAYAAATNIRCQIFVPDYTSEGKCVQIAMHGAELVRVPGTREDTTHAAEKAADSIYYASHNWSPYFAHGIKTYAFELVEQLGRAPDVIIVPAGQGSLVIGAHLAFNEMLAAGSISNRPRILAVQSVQCAPLYKAWAEKSNTFIPIDKGSTLAEGIASATPVRDTEVLAAVNASKGKWMAIEEDAIWKALNQLASVGLYVEPTSAIAAAALEQAVLEGEIGENECAAVLLSGSGLKATDTIGKLRKEKGKSF